MRWEVRVQRDRRRTLDIQEASKTTQDEGQAISSHYLR